MGRDERTNLRGLPGGWWSKIPDPTYPEYRLTVIWRSDRDGNGIRCYLEVHKPTEPIQALQDSFHPTLNMLEAVESALTEFFEGNH